MRIELDADECKEIVTILTESIGGLEAVLVAVRQDTDPRKYERWTAERARLIALRNKFVPGMKATVD